MSRTEAPSAGPAVEKPTVEAGETAPTAGTAVRGGSVAIAGQGARLLLQLVGLVFLGRLIGPIDFGLVAMVMAVLGVAEVFRDLGLSSAAIQAETLSRGQKNNLFWINSGLGLLLAGLAAAAAVPIASIYGHTELIGITLGLASMFAFNGVQTQFGVELARRLRFVSLASSEVVAAAAALSAALLAAVLGWGYWALVIQIAGQSLVLMAIRIAIARWRPGRPDRTASVRGMVRYGWNLMLTQTLIYLSSNLDKLLIGARFGPAALGLYSRAMQLVVLPANQLLGPATNVALPVLSRLRTDRERFAGTVLGAQLSLGYPIVAGLAVAVAVADPLLPLVMGQAWAPAVPLFRLLAAAALFQVVNYVVYWVFLAQGRTGSHLRYSLIARSILIIAVLVGALYSGGPAGTTGVAIGFLVGTVLGWPLALWWIRSWSLAPVRALLGNGSRVVVAGLVLGSAGWICSWLLTEAGLPLRLGGPIGAVAVGFALLAVIPAYRADFRRLGRSARHLRVRGGAS